MREKERERQTEREKFIRQRIGGRGRKTRSEDSKRESQNRKAIRTRDAPNKKN